MLHCPARHRNSTQLSIHLQRIAIKSRRQVGSSTMSKRWIVVVIRKAFRTTTITVVWTHSLKINRTFTTPATLSGTKLWQARALSVNYLCRGSEKCLLEITPLGSQRQNYQHRPSTRIFRARSGVWRVASYKRVRIVFIVWQRIPPVWPPFMINNPYFTPGSKMLRTPPCTSHCLSRTPETT